MDSNNQLILEEMPASTSSYELSWRMVHDGTIVITIPFESEGYTGTIHTLFTAATEEECYAEIERLGLIIPESEE